MSPNLLGITAMLLACACFVVNDSLVKLARVELPTSEVVVLRGVFATSFIFALARAAGSATSARSLLQPVVAVRSLLEVLVAFLFISALASLSLPTITAILQSVPLMVTAMSVAFLGTRVGWRRWTATAIGFLGVLLVVQPSPSGFETAALLALGSAVLVAVRDLVTQRIDPAVSSLTVALSTTGALTAAGLAVGPFTGSWSVPSPGAVLLLACAATVLAGGNYLMVVATRVAEMPVVAPFRYSTIFFSLALGFAIWGDLPNAVAVGGIVLVMGAGLYTIRREAIRAREARGPAPIAAHGSSAPSDGSRP